jgi:DNA-binding CsgD family transcriptional regulator
MAVAAGRATELDRVAPLSTLLGALLPTLRAGDAPVLDEAGVAELMRLGERESNRFWLVDQLGGLIAKAVLTRPLLVLLDDLQWADELTALTLRLLVPALRSAPVLWLLARRPLPVGAPAQDAADALLTGGARRIVLEPLGAGDVTRLCANLLGATPDPGTLTAAAGCGGNPFLVEELLVALRIDGRIRVERGVASIVDGGLPAGFVVSAGTRLRDLSHGARALLEAGAVLGRPFTLHEVAGMVAAPAVELVPATGEAVAAGLLVEDGDRLAFRHDLLREAVYGGLSGPVRQVLHREAAAVLRAERRSAAEVATHLVHDARRGDADAIAVLRAAAGEMVSTAPSTAADLTLQLLALLADDDAGRSAVVADAVRLLASAGRLAEAGLLGEAALRAERDPVARASIHIGLAESLKHAGQDDAAVDYTRRALAGGAVAPAVRAQLLATQAHALLRSDLAAADDAAGQAVAVGRSAGEPAAAVYGMVALSASARMRGELATATHLADDAVRLADEAAGEARHRHPRLWLGRALVGVDRFAEADAVYETGQREAERIGTAWSQPLWHFYRAELRLAEGRLAEATVEAEAGLRMTERLRATALTPSLLAALGQLAVHGDDMATAAQHLRAARAMADEGLGVAPDEVAWELALFRAASGRPELALDTLRTVYAAMPGDVALLSREPAAGPALVRLALRAGDRSSALAAAAAAAALAERNPEVASVTGAARHAEALLHGDVVGLRAAVADYRASPRVLLRASGLEDTALAEERAGDRAAAVALLEEALASLTECEARRPAARVRRRLRALGVRRRGSMAAAPQRIGWSSLTPSELRVVRLVARGLTNRDVAGRLHLSPHTVDSHLRHSFAKLGVTSRVDLTRQVIEQDGAEQTGP